MLGGFFSKIDRFYRVVAVGQALSDVTDATLGAGTSAAVANGFPANSPFNSDLPYDIKQFAVFGEVSYDLTDRLSATAGARYYDFTESRKFISGGLFANGDNRSDDTKSDGVSPRFILDESADFKGRAEPQHLEAALRVARFQQRKRDAAS